MEYQEIIPPVSRELLEQELTEEKFLRKTNYANNLLYIFTSQEAPNLMREVGRLRELTFRHAGGGTGRASDIDEFDTKDDPYHQIIVWDLFHREILGGYRFYIPRKNATGDDIVRSLSTSHLFKFSDKFKKEYLPHIIELGRSFVQPIYQSTSHARKGIYALDNLWDGLGALVVHNPEKKYLFGKVTMYPQFNRQARDLILYFLQKHLGDRENLLSPLDPLKLEWDEEEMKKIMAGNSYKEDYKTLSKKVRSLGETIPPLINAYMNLSPSMKTFGTMINHEFGDVEETGMMITIPDLYHAKIERHVSTYQRVKFYLKADKLF